MGAADGKSWRAGKRIDETSFKYSLFGISEILKIGKVIINDIISFWSYSDWKCWIYVAYKIALEIYHAVWYGKHIYHCVETDMFKLFLYWLFFLFRSSYQRIQLIG